MPEGETPTLVAKETHLWPTDRNAPRFERDKPKKLPQFLDRFERIAEDLKWTDEQRIMRLPTYTDWQTAAEWKSIIKRTGGKEWKKVKKAILKAYGETAFMDMGTFGRLSKICADHKGVDVVDFAKLLAFIREYVAEVDKLDGGRTSAISSREKVSKFLDTLRPGFRRDLISRLDIKNELGKRNATPAAEGDDDEDDDILQNDVRPDDRFTLDQVVKTAKEMASAQQGGFSESARDSDGYESRKESSDSDSDGETERRRQKKKSNKKKSVAFALQEEPRIKQEVEEMKGEIAGLRDEIKVSGKQQQESMGRMMATIREVNSVRHLTPQTQSQPIPRPPAPRTLYAPPQASGQPRPPYPFNCYYCQESGHMSNDCLHKKSHIEKGWIRQEGTQVRLKDGSYMPKGEGSIKSKVEKHYAQSGKSQMMAGMYPMPANTYASMYVNKERDVRDEVIQDLRDRMEYGYSQDISIEESTSQFDEVAQPPDQLTVEQMVDDFSSWAHQFVLTRTGNGGGSGF